MSQEVGGTRGVSALQMRRAVCKDCLREERARQAGIAPVPVPDEADGLDLDPEFVYNEKAALEKLERGQTRSDRCHRHRARHRVNIQGMAVPYIDLQTIGTVLDPEDPTGPFGGLGPMPGAHEITSDPVDLGQFRFGMEESDIMEMLGYLANPETRVLIVKAGTGTGKSTYMPYRLLDPPAGAPIRLTDLGPIVVTEPRVQATTGVAGFVGTKMSGADGVGPGYPVGFQVSGNRAHDDSCQLIFVTDGTMINWLREGRLSTIGTVIVDEAHERSTNIDFILGYLKKEVKRYPHLRVIVTSATFDAEFYREYFGGPDKVEVVTVPAVKSIGYGFPLFGELDLAREGDIELADDWEVVFAEDLPVRSATDPDSFITTHFAEEAPELKEGEVADGNKADVGWIEDLHETTRKLLPLRFTGTVPTHQWKEKMPLTLAEFVVKLARGLDREDIYGDILGFLPTSKSIEEAVTVIREGVDDDVDVFALLSSLPVDEKEDALAARRKGDRRKIVISTNLAETSLTVEGVRFVVDSGLIAQSDWDPGIAQGGIPTIPHSQAGIRQRWGRVGRKSPGWVFPLYSKAQFLDLAKDTPPGSTRDNLEELVMTAKLGGIDDVLDFDWPAAFEPKTVELDHTAAEAMKVFKRELRRADAALRTSGAVDSAGDPTAFGKELARAPGLESAASTIAIMHADRLACVPEVVTILSLLKDALIGSKGFLLDAFDWPDEWRLEAAERHRALASGCQDDAELALQVMSVWERADRDTPPWAASPEREKWARRWWINHERLRDCAEKRREILEALSPAMKEEVKRFVEPALARRARGAISRAMAPLEYRLEGEGVYRGVTGEGDRHPTGVLGNAELLRSPPERIIPLRRVKPERAEHAYLSSIVTVEDWAIEQEASGEEAIGVESSMRLLAAVARHGTPDTSRDLLAQLQEVWPAGSRVKLDFERLADGECRVVGPPASFIAPASLPVAPTDAEDPGAEEEAATPEDASPELDTTWPTPVVDGRRIELEPDPEVEAVLAVTEVEANEIDLQACGECGDCRSGDPDRCTNPYEPGDPGAATDELAVWRERASRNVDVSRPHVRMSSGEATDGGWYEVIGYGVDEAATRVVLRPDSAWAPGVHPDLEPGDSVEVIVGPELSDHRGPLRVFDRADGLGRFVLREAQTKPEKQEEQHQLAISLNRRTQGLLSQLSPGATLPARVVPRPQAECSTITFLQLLHAHWSARANRYEKFEVSLRDGRKVMSAHYGAMAVGEPNAAGRVTAESLLRDEETGISHLMGIRVAGDEDAPALADIGTVEEGTPLLVQVRRETVRLEIAGLPAPAVEEVVSRHLDLFHPPGPRPGDDGNEPPTDDPGESIPRGWALATRSPLTVAAARDLAGLSETREWESACWFYWARSHHQQTSRDEGFRPGDSSDKVILRADAGLLATVDGGTAAACSVTAPAPAHWLDVFRRERARLCELIGAVSIEVREGEVRIGFAGDEALVNGEPILRSLLGSAAASVQVPDGKVGVVIGRGGENIKRLQGTPGIWTANLDSESSTLLVIGEAAALSEVVADVAARVGGATGRMTVGASSDNGRLIGKQGVVIKELKERSGCSEAQSQGRDSVEWSLAGPAADNILKFIRLAQALVPSARGEVTGESRIQITDQNSEADVSDPRAHRWASP
jgi:HrpA-like RNA helicase/predicted RNA-binding protein YlqC (UPF0109 family)